MEFHISRISRDYYQFNHSLYSLSGNVILANFQAVRLFAQKMNQKRDLIHFPENAVKASQINAMGLIDEILHYVVILYREQKKSEVMAQALIWLEEKFGQENIREALLKFADHFPPIAVYQNKLTLDEYYRGHTEGIPNREILLEEMLMLWLENKNPAFSVFAELFDDSKLQNETVYQLMMSGLVKFFDTQPRFGPEFQNLIDMLRSPALNVPHSLSGQLEYIREHWGNLIGKYLYRLLGSLDFIKEEEKIVFPGGGPGIIPVPEYGRTAWELMGEHYSLDKDWMPRLVLIAKNIYVWLDQLSKKYKRPIIHLNEIPDEELKQLREWGFTGLWLIGIWERSKASQTIKQWCGNPEAVASAYSLYDYQIATDLGGEDAFQNLKNRAWNFGIRLASDMVPNHTGIDSKWVIEHPDWFISLSYSPFPSYTFNSSNLSNDGRANLYIEDHYYARSDAAVVFKRHDNYSGQDIYIYHGNDGTSMPWNDTAQLDYTKSEVREAVIQKIIEVARRTPIIRFDAAMTLAKLHYQRLWFPEPGTGGAIPSRSEFGMSKQEFDRLIPEEFWREVVNRIQQEEPDTLLLAEAFWLMEGYFVRTLGMHRVYNSAFMNLLRNEENAKYRQLMKNTLEFDPEILKRYVNFMNNPDERTAIDQFGKGDKYFGICTLMVTLPGLPMFGHGQIEGFTEKYGMEYRRAYWDESPDIDLIERHQREIFPLLHRRYIYSGVEQFYLYDFFTDEGYVNEDVYAYSNGYGEEHSLVIYNNKYANASGWIRTSVSYISKANNTLIQKSIGEGLQLHNDNNYYCVFRDHTTGLEYIRSSKEIYERGLFIEIGAYHYHVFLDIHEIKDDETKQFKRLTEYLNGQGVPSITEAGIELLLQQIHYPTQKLVNPDRFRELFSIQTSPQNLEKIDQISGKIEQDLNELFSQIKSFIGTDKEISTLRAEIIVKLKVILSIPQLNNNQQLISKSKKRLEAINFLQKKIDENWHILFGWLFVHALGKISDSESYIEQSRAWIDEWRLNKCLVNTFKECGIDENSSWQAVTLIKILTAEQKWYEGITLNQIYPLVVNWFQDIDIQRYLGVNRFQDILWFNEEPYTQFLWAMSAIAIIQLLSDTQKDQSVASKEIETIYKIIKILDSHIKKSEFQIEKYLEAIHSLPAIQQQKSPHNN
jgi:glycosidase